MTLPTINWSQLEKLNAVKFIQTMYIWVFLLPILVKLILVKLLEHVGESARLTIFGYTFEALLSLPFSWIAFYFSALAFALANLIFQARCPSIIKDHRKKGDRFIFLLMPVRIRHSTGVVVGTGTGYAETGKGCSAKFSSSCCAARAQQTGGVC